MKKYFWTLSVMALFAIGFAASDEDETTSNSSLKQEEKPIKKKNTIVGTYEATDKIGCTMRITLKEDGTATITGVRGENVTYYCTWSDQSYYKNRLAIVVFSDPAKRPYLIFEGGTTAVFRDCLFLSKDGYLYYNVHPETNNPEWRIPCKKI